MRPKKNFNKDQVQILPITLLPSSFPRKSFLTVKSVQTLLNELIHKVAYDKEFLTSSLRRYQLLELIIMELFLQYRITLFEHYIILAQSKLIRLQQSYFTYMRQYMKKVLARYVILNINM